jgi:tetratricopeptide (TPR) repeat protein
MSHLGPEAMRRFLRGEAASRDPENAAEHIVSCDRCRALAGSLVDELGVEGLRLRKEGPLQLVLDLIEQERRWGMESLAAIAEWAELRRIPSRRGQRDRVRMTKTCQTIAFFRHILGELREESSWEEAEFFAGLALLSIEGMHQRQQIAQNSYEDLQAEVWTAVANARRRAAEWNRAHQALSNAERHLKSGTGDCRLKAGLLSISASTLADEGHVSEALDALAECKAIYDSLSEWALLGRTLIQQADILAVTKPAKGLEALDHASPLIPAEDSYLTLLAELLRVECLIEVGKPGEALQVYRRCSRFLIACSRSRMQIRGRFTGARLLDAHGFKQQAERLFGEVIDRDIEHELYKDAFLDLLYLYGRHVQSGEPEKAARVCHRALTEPALSAVAHEQIRSLWEQLLNAAHRQAISQELLRDLRQYLSVHWKHPAATPPVVTFL